jgi:colanic acid biosynthesis glycosyl transferase WcaI
MDLRLRVCIVSCVFPPEPVVSAQTSSQIAEELARLGHQVTVIAPVPSRPSGKIYSGFGLKLFQREITATGIEIIRCLAFPSPESTLLSRALENISFGISAVIALAWLPKPQVIYANTWPLLAIGLLAAFARLRCIPVVTSVQDIYPESLFVQKRIAHGTALAKALIWLDKKIAGSAAALVVLSERFKELYIQTRNMPAEKLHVVPNWGNLVDLDSKPDDRMNFRKQKGIPDKAFCFVYAGNIGAAAGLEDVISAFEELVDDPNIYLLIAGSGSRLENCRKQALRLGLERVIFHSPWLESETSQVLGLADVFILPTNGLQSMTSVPSKLITYMLAARPVLAVAEPGSDVELVIQAAGCGWALPPHQPQKLGKTLVECSKLSRDLLEQLGKEGRIYARQHFRQSDLLCEVIDLILKVAG